MGTALPGPPVSTVELLDRLRTRFEVDVRRQGMILAARLGIRTRHISRDFTRRTKHRVQVTPTPSLRRAHYEPP